jgi:ribonuclease HI
VDNLWEKSQYLSRKICYRFQDEIYAILACTYEIQRHARPKQYISICSDSREALKALQTAKTTSPLVQQFQKALNDISIQYSVGLFWISVHFGVRGNETTDGLAREGIVHQFVGPEPALGVSRQNTRKKIHVKCWV